MSWSLYRWTWQLESPLYVGATPAGSLNRCRLYVPARSLWAALTAELARMGAKGNAIPYQEVGEQLKLEARFTYLYPAEKFEDIWCAWLPRYEVDKGLIWQREDQQHANAFLTLQQMRMRLLTTRPCTAIDPLSDTAVEGSLRETECLRTHWLGTEGCATSRVAMVGYLFWRHNSSLNSGLESITSIAIGGDTRYGLGRLCRIAFTPEQTVFGMQVELTGSDPIVNSPIIYAHAVESENLVGSREMLVSWDNANGKGLFPQNTVPLWVPGSTVATGETACHKWKVEQSGLWAAVR